MTDKIITSVGFGVGMMIFLTMSFLTSGDPITTRVILAIIGPGLLCGFLWYVAYERIIKRKK